MRINKPIEDISKKDEKKLNILTEVAKIINSNLDIDSILKFVVDVTIGQLGYHLFSILLKEGDYLVIKTGHGMSKKELDGGIRVKIGSGITGSVAVSGEPEIVNDVTKDDRYLNFAHNMNCQSNLAVPIKFGNELIGVFNVEDENKGAFTKEDEKIIQSLSDNVAVAIRNARLLEDLKNSNENLSIIYETSKIINSNLVLSRILKNIFDIGTKKLSYNNFSILLLEKNGIFLKEEFVFPRVRGPKLRLSTRRGISGSVVRSGNPIVINDVSKDDRYVAIRDGIKSELVVPIKIKNRVIGVFNVESRRLNAFNENDLFLVSALADQASIAIHNANINTSLEQSNQRLEAINEIGKIINSSLDLDSIFKKFLKFALEDLNYLFCSILLVEDGKVRLRSMIGYTESNLANYSAEIGEGICGMVVKTGKPQILNDVTKNKHYRNMSAATKSEIAVPLRVEEKIIGVLNIESRELNAFNKDDLIYLSAIADQAAIAIRNAQNYVRIKNFNLELKGQVSKATKDLRKANTELEKLNEIKSDFVSTVSHELRTPLTSIHGYAALMFDQEVGEISEDQKEFLGIIKEESERLTRLINDLLDISKIESGKFQISLDKFDFLEFIKGYKKEVSNMCKAKKMKVEYSLPKSLPNIKADEDKVKQILYNLLSNAIKFSPKESTIQFRVFEDKSHINVEVLDKGIGIGKEDLPKIFEKFRQVDSKMTRKIGGTGLGLAITKHLVENHGGKMWVKSKLNEGSTFGFSLSKS